jgi:diguanylate cyclase (GGDEF)-like protein/PAS domain S-box-containing protein
MVQAESPPCSDADDAGCDDCLFVAIVNDAPDAIFAKDQEGNYLFYNRESCRQAGCGPEAVIGRGDGALFPAEEAEAIRQQDRRVLTEQRSVRFEETLTTRDGRRTFDTVKHPLKDRQGRLQGLYGIARDITESKAEQADLGLAALAFQSHEGMLITDANRVILKVNAAFTRLTGYSAAEAVGQTPAMLKSGRQPGSFYRAMWETLDREGHWEGVVWNRRKNGSVFAEWLSVTAIRNDAGETTHYLGVFSDISEPREAKSQIMQLAFYDPLTGLPNRRLLLDRLNQAVAGCNRSSDSCALMFLDLDNFKTLNDTDGHDVGDRLLAEVARRLEGLLRHSDTAARLGGDEFVVLLENLDEDEMAAAAHAEQVAEKIRLALSQPYDIQGRVRYSASSIGITLFRGRGEGAEALLKQADLALYQAKSAGRNTVRFFNPAMQAAIDAHARMEEGLRRALLEGHLHLLFQPQVDEHGHMVGAEALLRWHTPEGQVVSPGTFIPVAEGSNLIIPMGRWVLHSACRQLAAWGRDPATRHLSLSVNISARQFSQADFVEDVAALLEETGADPGRLRLELTESLVVSDVEQVIRTMGRLKEMGVTFSMDDFGTGYSSLGYLKRLPLEELKIDQSFVRDIPHDQDVCAIASAVIALARSLSLNVVAEGVETHAQREFLATQGCRYYQGYLYGYPATAEEVTALARSRRAGETEG